MVLLGLCVNNLFHNVIINFIFNITWCFFDDLHKLNP